MNVPSTVNDLINPYRSVGTSRGQGMYKPGAHGAPALPPGKSIGGQPAIKVREVSLADLDVKKPRDAPSAEAPEHLTLRGLREAWGQSDSPYDLNLDGTVNFADMLQLIERLGESHNPVTAEPTPPPVLGGAEPITGPQEAAGTEEVEETDRPVTLRSILNAFGKRDTQYDINADGTVNFGDVIEFLRQQRGVEPPTPTTPNTPNLSPATPDLLVGTTGSNPTEPTPTLADAAPDLGAAGPNDGPPPITIDELRAAFGKRNERLDLNGDGVVNFGDFLKLLASRGEQEPSGSQRADEIAGADRFAERAAFKRTQPIAESLVNQLRAKGFRTHPPANLHQVVAQLDLTPHDQKALLHQLNAKYPAGLGVNLRG